MYVWGLHKNMGPHRWSGNWDLSTTLNEGKGVGARTAKGRQAMDIEKNKCLVNKCLPSHADSGTPR